MYLPKGHLKILWYQRLRYYKILHGSNRSSSSVPRHNSLNIQMLSQKLHDHIFKTPPQPTSSHEIKKVEAHLKKHGLAGKTTSSSQLPEVDLKLPPLFGKDINEHFVQIANDQLAVYKSLIEELAYGQLPTIPTKWQFKKGWTKYNADGSFESVTFPEDRGLVFDIECLMSEGNYPTMATAVSPTHWYSWVSEFVIQDKFRWISKPKIKDLIPLETLPDSIAPPTGEWLPRLIIGHNVGFDRSFVKEQYLIEGTELRFLDTMSMHIAVCGQTSLQRLLHKAGSNGSGRKEIVEHKTRQKLFNTATSREWKKVSSMNNLRDVHQLHCGGELLEKEKRDVFVNGNMSDVREQFQQLMAYCADDVKATYQIFAKLWPEFQERFPHPVTLAGMLEMGSAFLPVNDAWPRYIQNANNTYMEMAKELKKLLMGLADEACGLLHNQEYKNDPWLWDLEWKLSEFCLNKSATNTRTIIDPFAKSETKNNPYPEPMLFQEGGKEAFQEYQEVVKKTYAAVARVPKNPVFMAGYPSWYKDLCPRPTDEDFYPGPSCISTQCRVAAKLMRLTWEGFPVHYDEKYGWGYLVPHAEELTPDEEELRSQDTAPPAEHSFPLKAYLAFLKENKPSALNDCTIEPTNPMESLDSQFLEDGMELEETLPHWESTLGKKTKKVKRPTNGPLDIGISGVRFCKIPHKDGNQKRVGNPLARDYLSKVEDGTISASIGTNANRILMLSRMCSYWKNNQKRIMSQWPVWLNSNELSQDITSHPNYHPDDLYGAIIPHIVTAQTITRRAFEPTWLTASNPYKDRIGSELKGMVQPPPGYHFVGADVDSQELWIAAMLGDAFFMKEHGCTALGWMTLQGSKADKTDLHSKTAEIFNISRDHAKVMNYGRIYGTGQTLAARLLMQFNPQLNPEEANRLTKDMYKKTKGERNAQKQWIGGRESYMFNALETIANSEKPVTPVLGCRISKALEPCFVLDDFLTSRVNWVVQSSAVDYLHLMLVCMRWLLSTYKIKGRFCVSIHDEVRYLVSSPDRYRAALALQETNLLTRSMFAYRLGLKDLPQSVAFFSAIDLDTCLRKEVTMDCITPSNPHGLQQRYNVSPGEALNIYEIIDKTQGRLEPTSNV